MDIEIIKNKLKDRKVNISGHKTMKKYSLLIPLININNELNIIFEVRAKTLKTQPGDVCFPGGKDYFSLEGLNSRSLKKIVKNSSQNIYYFNCTLNHIIINMRISIHSFFNIMS